MTDFWDSDLETMPADALLSRQLDLAGAQVERLAGTSDFYRRRLADAAIRFSDVEAFADAAGWTTKEQVIAAQRDVPPYGGMLTVPPDELTRIYVYPNGQVLGWSAQDEARLAELYAGGLYTAGVRRTDLVDVTFQYHWVVAGTIWDQAVRHLGAAAVPGGAGESSRHAVNARLLGVSCLIGFSTFMERIGESAAEQGIDPSSLGVRTIVIVGEWHGSDAKARLSDTYGGARVREAYGTGEAGLVAAECDADPTGMHVHPDVLIEVRHEHTGELAGEGEGGEVYLTPLASHAMPVLRFRTGDITEFLRREPCACGRTTPRIGRIIGRTGQLLRVKGVFLSRPLVEAVLGETVRSPAPFQLHVDRPHGLDRLRLRMESAQQLSDDVLAAVVHRMKARASVTIELDVVPMGAVGDDAPWFVDERS